MQVWKNIPISYYRSFVDVLLITVPPWAWHWLLAYWRRVPRLKTTFFFYDVVIFMNGCTLLLSNSSITICVLGWVCIRAKWPTRRELILVSLAWSNKEYSILKAIYLLTLHYNTCRAFPCDNQSSKVDTALDCLTWDMGYLLKWIKNNHCKAH